MSPEARAEIRRSQAIMTFGPGALIDLPEESAIMGGLDGWPAETKLERIEEPRLCSKLRQMTGVAHPRLFAPPADDSLPWEQGLRITAWRFPNWFLVQEPHGQPEEGGENERSRRLVQRDSLDQRQRFDGQRVVPTRFVQACPRGHISDLSWRRFVHGGATECPRQLWLDERGTGGDLADIVARCECKASRRMSEAMDMSALPLGICNGDRPWLGRNAREDCNQLARLLLRTATNAYFAQTVSVLSLPEARSGATVAVEEVWDVLQAVTEAGQLTMFRTIPKVAKALEGLPDAEVMDAISRVRDGAGEDRPVKLVELEAILGAPAGYQEDVPPDEDFYARRLPESIWRRSGLIAPVEAVIQLHRLREVIAMPGFTRFEALMPDIHGEYDTDVTPASIALDPDWFPAIENRGEGIFVQLEAAAIEQWLKRPAVKARAEQLIAGFKTWCKQRKKEEEKARYVGLPYVLIHTLSHLVLQSLSITCGYPASSIRERIYVGDKAFGFLLYTGTPDADGTLGGLVSEARHIERHLTEALRMATLCSNDPICAGHDAGASMEGRWLTGAACHGCCFIAETSCEMRNEYLDRALVVPTLGHEDVAFFSLEA